MEQGNFPFLSRHMVQPLIVETVTVEQNLRQVQPGKGLDLVVRQPSRLTRPQGKVPKTA
jgi:hypothetical protein